MAKVIDSTNLGYLIGKIKAAFWAKSDTSQVTIDATPTASSTNLVESGGVYAEVHPDTGSSIPVGGLLPGVKYHLGTLTGSITMTLATASDASVENEYKGDFTADSTAPTITWQGVTEWAGNCLDSGTGLPVITAGKHYEFNIENGYGVIVEYGV